jgi:glycosyltransferase involved in cell wall biosynthesis
MKIAIVCSRLGLGGAERVAVLWANSFVNKGYEVILISNLFEDITYHVDDRVKLKNLISTNNNKFLKWFSAFLNTRKIFNEVRPDIAIGIMGTCSIVSWFAALGIRISVIASEHNAFERPSYASLSYKDKIIKFFIYRFFRCVTVLSEADRCFVKGKLKNVFVMPNPLPMEPVHDVLATKKTVLAVGRLDDWHCKGFDVLIKAFAKLVQSSKFKVQNEGWKLQIAGTGSKESLNYLKQLCKENGVEDSVEFLGFRKDVENLYQDASIFVLSSRYEGFGLVLIEAMSQGCACVACDYKGRQREIMSPQGQGSRFKVQGSDNKVELCETGILCEPDDVESLAAGIQKMIEDDEYRESVRAKAIERSKYYSIENTMDRWDALLKQIV